MLWNFTVDAPSPYINYVGSGWGPLNGYLDPYISQYSNRTAVDTPNAGDVAKFVFNGTAIWVYGAERPNHGEYTVQMDNDPSTTYNGTGPNPGSFQALTFSQQNLPIGQHQFAVTNDAFEGSGNGFFDIDYIIYQSQLPDNSRSILLDDTDPFFTYLPSTSDWSPTNDNSSYRDTLCRTQTSDGTALLTFSGSAAIGLYGRMGTDNGKYLCQIDDQPTTQYSANWKFTANQQLLCFASGLDSSPGVHHTISITNVKSDMDSWLEVDFVQLYGPNPAGLQYRPSRRKTAVAAVVGGVIGGLVGLSLLACCLFFACRRKRRRDREQRCTKITDESAPKSFPADAFGIYSPQTNGSSSHLNTVFSGDSSDPNNPFNNPSYPEGSRTPTSPADSGSLRTGTVSEARATTSHIPLSEYSYGTYPRSSTSLSIPDSGTLGHSIRTISSYSNLNPVSPGTIHRHPQYETIYEHETSPSQLQPRSQLPYLHPLQIPRQRPAFEHQLSYEYAASVADTTAATLMSPTTRRERDAGLLMADETATLPPDYDDVRGGPSFPPPDQPGGTQRASIAGTEAGTNLHGDATVGTLTSLGRGDTSATSNAYYHRPEKGYDSPNGEPSAASGELETQSPGIDARRRGAEHDGYGGTTLTYATHDEGYATSFNAQ